MQSISNFQLAGAAGRPILLDLTAASVEGPAPVVIYAHGFNGFKDWGRFELVANQFAASGMHFASFNFSHNGTRPEAPTEFVDLEAFGQNNYTKELEDLYRVIAWITEPTQAWAAAIDTKRIFLLGHSRGGGVVLITASENSSIAAVTTWASVAESKTPWGRWTPAQMEQWKQLGVAWYHNARTGQDMPLYYQLYEDYCANKERLDILSAVRNLQKPLLICHGTKDEAVPVEKAFLLKAQKADAELYIVESDHVFGRKHPWTEDILPEPMQLVVNKTIAFFSDLP
jgi:uncharacterized protein